MSETRIYGASDDLIEVEGQVREEFNWYVREEERRFLAFSDGTVLECRYDGCWRFTVRYPGACTIAIRPATDKDSDDYSDRATLTGEIHWVVFGEGYAYAR